MPDVVARLNTVEMAARKMGKMAAAARLLQQENQRLKQQLRYRQRQAEQGFFGSSTPSSKVALKANTADANRSDPGGLKAGPPGHARQATAILVSDSPSGQCTRALRLRPP